MPKIEFKNFSFRYHNLKEPTLKNINLEINSGEKVLIAGRSGSGKSTLIHCLNGIIPFYHQGEITGSLTIGDMEPYKENIFKISRHVGTVLQDQDAQFIGLTVAEDVAFILENLCVPSDEMKKTVEIRMKSVEMEEFAGHSPFNLSGGQKQRVSLAGVLSSNAEILVLDEPLANLDPASGKNSVAFIDDLSRNTGATVIVVEHRSEDIFEKPIDKVIVVDNGEITACGTPDEIIGADAFRKAGLREPLYISALRYSGCKINASSKAAEIGKCVTNDIRLNLKKWFESGTERYYSTSEREKVLSVKNLAFSYDSRKKVVDDISFDVNKGEIVSILGNNGAGKSTLSALITGILKPSSGDILLNGEAINSWSVKKRGEKIGLVMQNPNCMIVKQMVMDEVGLGLRNRNHDEKYIDEKLKDVLTICGLWGYRNWPVNSLSYGQKKRVTIASILTTDPQVIILDEPTAGQDYKTYTAFMGFIKRIADTGISVMLITHDIHLALEYTSRSIVLSNGKKIADDTPARIFSRSDVIERARLKETSLGILAEIAEIDKDKFIQHFINFERSKRSI